MSLACLDSRDHHELHTREIERELMPLLERTSVRPDLPMRARFTEPCRGTRTPPCRMASMA